jgi:hypothetical protein
MSADSYATNKLIKSRITGLDWLKVEQCFGELSRIAGEEQFLDV